VWERQDLSEVLLKNRVQNHWLALLSNSRCWSEKHVFLKFLALADDVSPSSTDLLTLDEVERVELSQEENDKLVDEESSVNGGGGRLLSFVSQHACHINKS
jgi:hypothetical protein